MRYRPQQICPHCFFLCFHQKLFPFIQKLALFFKACRCRTGNGRHQQHAKKGHRISVYGKIKVHIWKCKNIIDKKYAKNRRNDSGDISSRITGYQHDCQHIDNCNTGRVPTVMKKSLGHNGRYSHDQQRDQHIMQDHCSDFRMLFFMFW